ncbi:MAG: calcium-binding EGF-like domain-containing protein [Chitinophagaceae bacterium]|nr:calcium-binding EGF-like domain-containing protein [Chitinophagaceae bacterium]
MKQSIFRALVAILFIISAAPFFSSCNPDACVTRATECKNGGVCRDGDCECALGYEGDSCQFTANKKFEGYYACAVATLVKDNPPQSENDDTLRLKMNAGDRFGLTMYSVRDSIFERINLKVSGNYITIPQQDIYFIGDVYRYTGSGSLNDGWITIHLKKEFLDPNQSFFYEEERTYVGQYYEP